MSNDYFEEFNWWDEDGLPRTPPLLYGARRSFAMGSERWDYYYNLHKEKSKESYNPYEYLKEFTNEF